MISSTPSSVLQQRAALVRWPEERGRRATLATSGVPCLLVLDPGTPVPPLGPAEDWIQSTSDERDVAVRLERLARSEREHRALAPIELPDGLSGAERRVACRLADSIDRFVPVEDLAVEGLDGDELDEAIRSLGAVFEASGLRLTPVGDAGFLLERAEPTPP